MAANLLSSERQSAANAETLLQAVESGDTSGVEALLAAGIDVNAPIKSGQTALMVAAAKGHAEVVKTLLAAGADVNVRRKDGFTSLYAATFFGNTDIVRLLVDKGADLHAKTLLDSTAKSWALSKGFQEIAELLEAAEKNHQVADAQAIELPENLPGADSKNDLNGNLEASTKSSAAEPIVAVAATLIEPEEIKFPESVEEKHDGNAPVTAPSEPSEVMKAGFPAEELGAEIAAADNLNEITIVTPGPTAPALIDSPPNFTVEKIETTSNALAAEQPPPSIAALSEKVHNTEYDQRSIHTVELEPEAQLFVPTQLKRTDHTWNIAAAAILVMFAFGLVTYLLVQHQSHSTTRKQTQASIKNESLTNDSKNQPADSSFSAATTSASLKPKDKSDAPRPAAPRQQQPDEPATGLSQNLSSNKKVAATLHSQSKNSAITSSLPPVNLGRNAARSNTRDAAPRTPARVNQSRETDSSPLPVSKREAKRQRIKTSTNATAPDSVSSKVAPASNAPTTPSPAPKRRVINWP